MPKNSGKEWTREDIRTLRQEAPDRNISTDEIAKHLGRTIAAVRAAAQCEEILLRSTNR